MKKRTIATMTQGTLYCTTVLAYYIFDDYWPCSVFQLKFTKIFWGLDSPISLPEYDRD